jgi:hypothetical protein
MDAKYVNAISTTLGPWVKAAYAEMLPEAKAELAKCLFGGNAP